MKYIKICAPPYPFFIYAGDALFRTGDFHRKRSDFALFDLLFVEHGCLYMMEDGVRYEVKANDMLILSPGNTHSSYKACSSETYFHWLHFDTTEPFLLEDKMQGKSKTLRDFSRKNTRPETLVFPVFQSLPTEKAAVLLHLMDTLESYSIDRYQKSNMIVKENNYNSSRLRQQEIFCKLLSDITVSESPANKSNQIAGSVMQYLNANYYNEISLKDMAAAANCHPTHVIRCFKTAYNTTPGKMLTQIRLNHAQELLMNSSFTCAAISEKVGFSSSSYFCKVFTDFFKMSPMDFRKQAIP